MCNSLTVKKGTIEGIIPLLILLVLLITGCTTPYTRVWESQLWQVSETNNTEMAELGQLETVENTFSLICTEFRQADNPSNTFIGIGILCRNDTNETLTLQYNPIQVVDASLTITKPLPLDHVMYNLYGGLLRERSQLAKLIETSIPLASYGGPLLKNALVAVINAYRAYERSVIITKFHKKEALPYDLYYKSFTPTSLPPGVSIAWVDYYPTTTDTITVILQGLKVEEGVIFSKPPPSVALSETSMHPVAIIIAALGVIGIVIAFQT